MTTPTIINNVLGQHVFMDMAETILITGATYML